MTPPALQRTFVLSKLKCAADPVSLGRPFALQMFIRPLLLTTRKKFQSGTNVRTPLPSKRAQPSDRTTTAELSEPLRAGAAARATRPTSPRAEIHSLFFMVPPDGWKAPPMTGPHRTGHGPRARSRSA